MRGRRGEGSGGEEMARETRKMEIGREGQGEGERKTRREERKTRRGERSEIRMKLGAHRR